MLEALRGITMFLNEEVLGRKTLDGSWPESQHWVVIFCEDSDDNMTGEHGDRGILSGEGAGRDGLARAPVEAARPIKPHLE